MKTELPNNVDGRLRVVMFIFNNDKQVPVVSSTTGQKSVAPTLTSQVMRKQVLIDFFYRKIKYH